MLLRDLSSSSAIKLKIKGSLLGVLSRIAKDRPIIKWDIKVMLIPGKWLQSFESCFKQSN